MPMDYAEYHPDWRSISRQIREQAGNVCEFCAAPNGQRIIRNADGEWVLADELHLMNWKAGWNWLGTWPRFPSEVRIVLTVAHLDHDKDNNDPANLRALCQRCHLRWDAEHHARNAAETRRQKRIASGQGALWCAGRRRQEVGDGNGCGESDAGNTARTDSAAPLVLALYRSADGDGAGCVVAGLASAPKGRVPRSYPRLVSGDNGRARSSGPQYGQGWGRLEDLGIGCGEVGQSKEARP